MSRSHGYRVPRKGENLNIKLIVLTTIILVGKSLGMACPQ